MARSFTTMCFSALSPRLALAARLCRTGAAAWVMVLTVLCCALLPAGLPLTTTQGSAFNPATTGVALTAKGPERRAAGEQRVHPDPRGAGPHGVGPHGAGPVFRIATLPPASIAAPRPGAAALPARIEPATLHAQAFTQLRWPRAPPAA